MLAPLQAESFAMGPARAEKFSALPSRQRREQSKFKVRILSKRYRQKGICKNLQKRPVFFHKVIIQKRTLTMNKLFKNRKLVIATMHKKEAVMKQIIEKALGVHCVIPKDFDTDKFGTFTREIKRKGDQLQTIRAKLIVAMDEGGYDLGVASEGSFDAHPSIPFIQSNLELTLFIDRKNNLEIKGHYRSSKTNINGKYVSTIKEAVKFAKDCGFPEHGMIVRRTENGKFFIYKNIQTEADFKKTVKKILALPFTSKVFIETDMRAHKNPTRMEAIKKSTEDLVKNIASKCPKCQSPGFVIVNVEKGLPCGLCGLPTDIAMFEILSCVKCKHKEKRKITKYGKVADAGQCQYCNP